MTLLVTGGAGFIGANFIRHRRRRAPTERLVVLDALTYAGNMASLAGLDFDFVHADICDADLVGRTLAEFSIDAIVHFAAESHVDRSILGPLAFVQTNAVGTATLLEAARRAGVKRFVQVSTDEVYGDLGPADPPFSERSPIQPRSPYAATKAAADLLALAYFETYRFPVLVTRCSNNYGPYQFPEKLIPLMLLNALSDTPLPIYGDGLNVRDWIHVEDHCAAVSLVLDRGREGHVYNIGGQSERTNLEVVQAILAAVGKPESLLQRVADRLGHDRRYAIDNGKIEHELGWVRTHTFEAGLAATIEWYRANEPWWTAIRSGAYQAWYAQNYTHREGAP